MLNCDFAFCVYQKEGSCILSSIDINSAGVCDNAISIDLPEEELQQRKAALLTKFRNYETEWSRENTS